MVQTDEERKAKRKEVRDRPENRAKRKISSKEYDSRPEVKAHKQEYSKVWSRRLSLLGVSLQLLEQ